MLSLKNLPTPNTPTLPNHVQERPWTAARRRALVEQHILLAVNVAGLKHRAPVLSADAVQLAGDLRFQYGLNCGDGCDMLALRRLPCAKDKPLSELTAADLKPGAANVTIQIVQKYPGVRWLTNAGKRPAAGRVSAEQRA